MNIPEAAQVAAEIAYLEAYMKSNGDHIRSTRAALEAAAPHMLADGWDEGFNYGVGRESYDITNNPYRPI